MQKYIAVVNPKMDEDDIDKLLREGIAGVLFEISHQNYPTALRLIEDLKKLSKKYNHPISIIQDISQMEDPLDLEFGNRAGINWVATDKHEHAKLARGVNKLLGVINKGKNLPKSPRVDSVMAHDLFADPDAMVGSHYIRHLIDDHKNQGTIDGLLHIAHASDADYLALSDFDLMAAMSMRRPKTRIVFVPKDERLAEKSSIYFGVQPVYNSANLEDILKQKNIAKKGGKFVDARDRNHVTIRVIS